MLYRPSALESTPNGILRVFIVHEGLSALGLNDEDYAVSLSLEFLVRKELQVNTTPELQKLFRDQIESAKYITANRGYLADSGGTSVGGGGEPDPIDVKYHLLIRAMKHTQAVAFAKEVLNARIEVDNQNTIQEKNGYKQGMSGNKFHFMFRASDWQSDDQFKILLLNHVQKRLEEQIP
ncbi:MAG: hypothetical protein R3A80_10280 [Bdellovibrionota bacterium]